MFKVTKWTNNGNWSVTDENRNYMHADGSVFHRCGEYWPTREQAQVVLDKHQPPHVWKHGDVFKDEDGCLAMCAHITHVTIPQIIHLTGPDTGSYERWEEDHNATFLFNIKDKLGDS